MKPIVCPACLRTLGHGTERLAGILASEHGPLCPETGGSHQQALTNAVFRSMTRDLNL